MVSTRHIHTMFVTPETAAADDWISEKSDATTRMTGITQDLVRHMNDVTVIDHTAHTSGNTAAPIPLSFLEIQAYASEDIATVVMQKTMY